MSKLPQGEEIDAFKKDGVFWDESSAVDGVNPEKFMGRIEYDRQHGISLHVAKELTRQEAWGMRGKLSGDDDKPLNLQGHIDTFGPITLFSGFLSSRQSDANGLTKYRYYFNRALIGGHADSPTEETFSRLDAIVSGLGYWLNQYAIQITGHDEQSVTLRAWTPVSEYADLAPGVVLEIGWAVSYSVPYTSEKTASLHSQPRLSLLFSDPKPLAEVRKHFGSALALLTVLAGAEFDVRTINLTATQADADEPGEGPSAGPDHQSKRPATLILRYLDGKQTPPRRPLEDAHRALIPFGEVEDWAGLVKRWDGLRQKLGTEVLDVLGGRYHLEPYAETSFLLAASALERLHGRLFAADGLEDHRLTTDQIRRCTDTLGPEFEESVETYLQQFGRPGFRRRLAALLERASDLADWCIGDESIQKQFVNTCTHWRNELAHCLAPKPAYRRRTGWDFMRTNLRLFALLDFFVLRELGLPREKVVRRIREASRHGSWIEAPWQACKDALDDEAQ